MIPFLFVVFWMSVILLELTTGVAYVGWIGGGSSIVEREKAPVFYWFAVAIQMLVCCVLPFFVF